MGNIFGGTGCVGLVYWFIYLRPRRESQPSQQHETFKTETAFDLTTLSVKSAQDSL
jgi:hypothetical protein